MNNRGGIRDGPEVLRISKEAWRGSSPGGSKTSRGPLGSGACQPWCSLPTDRHESPRGSTARSARDAPFCGDLGSHWEPGPSGQSPWKNTVAGYTLALGSVLYCPQFAHGLLPATWDSAHWFYKKKKAERALFETSQAQMLGFAVLYPVRTAALCGLSAGCWTVMYVV